MITKMALGGGIVLLAMVVFGLGVGIAIVLGPDERAGD